MKKLILILAILFTLAFVVACVPVEEELSPTPDPENVLSDDQQPDDEPLEDEELVEDDFENNDNNDEQEARLEVAIEELTALFSGVDGVNESSFEADEDDKLMAKIVFTEPHDVSDFPALVVSFVDDIIRVANEHDVLVSELDVAYNQMDRILRDLDSRFRSNFVTYRSRNESENNDALKFGSVSYSAYNLVPRDRHGGIRYDNIPTFDEDVATNVERMTDLLSITSVSTSRPNSAGGVDCSISWRIKSNTLQEYPHSLSYQLTSFTNVSVRAMPAFLSKMDVRASPMKSLETTISSV